eukprot:1990353-Alexandrium_andersonii.AAC.1
MAGRDPAMVQALWNFAHAQSPTTGPMTTTGRAMGLKPGQHGEAPTWASRPSAAGSPSCAPIKGAEAV